MPFARVDLDEVRTGTEARQLVRALASTSRALLSCALSLGSGSRHDVHPSLCEGLAPRLAEDATVKSRAPSKAQPHDGAAFAVLDRDLGGFLGDVPSGRRGTHLVLPGFLAGDFKGPVVCAEGPCFRTADELGACDARAAGRSAESFDLDLERALHGSPGVFDDTSDPAELH